MKNHRDPEDSEKNQCSEVSEYSVVIDSFSPEEIKMSKENMYNF